MDQGKRADLILVKRLETYRYKGAWAKVIFMIAGHIGAPKGEK
jgi:hypothetical protein